MVQVCVITPNKGLKDKMIPVGYLYDWQWSITTKTNNMPRLVTDFDHTVVKGPACELQISRIESELNNCR